DRNHTALRVMRDYRLKMLKEECPRSNWKLLEAKGCDDVIFEWSVPKAGAFAHKYTLERIIVGEYGFQKISIELDQKPKDLNAWITELREHPTEVTPLPKNAPKRFA
ncbi:MAG: hypothetical protein P0S94_03345, partial [Simkaniaceae bacterium]|nr:hypothetical protein [Simkaniaceae bacterium]